MNTTLLKILNSREDISDYLFHFTNGSGAFDTLEKIVEDSAIIDKNSRGYICFTESPIILLKEMFNIFDKFVEPMYSPYGIAIKKETLFNHGARHVIYGPLNEKNDLPEKFRWRFEDYAPNERDYTWLREWRLNEPKFILTKENCFFITKTKDESVLIGYDENDGLEIEVEAEPADGGFEYFYSEKIKRKFKCTSIEEIDELSKLSKSEVDKIIELQGFDDTYDKYLGATWA